MSSTPSSFASLSATFLTPASRGTKKRPSPADTRRDADRESEHLEQRRRERLERDALSAPIICFCHLSWHWVWQRPQQYLSRFAQRHPVLFVETYCTDTPKSFARVHQPDNAPNVTVLETHFPAARWADGAFIDAERHRLVRETLALQFAGEFDRAILWFYDPMAVTAFAGQLGEQLIVYDCMDELSQFRGAPPELIAREKQLLARADVVFCGGRKMRDKRLPLNPNTHFFGTGVDCAHFGAALGDGLPVHPDVAKISRPVLGYFGVIDERIDYALLAALAEADPAWSIVMVGPTAKVDPAELPRYPNLHWFGGRDYKDLPAITKGFDVCLMPFALNAATEYINPTKTLEYMAAGKPVVSTALDEVKSNFGSVARIAGSPAEFIALCRREARSPSRLRIARGVRLAAENAWEANVAKMEAHIVEALVARRHARSSAHLPATLSLPSTSAAYV